MIENPGFDNMATAQTDRQSGKAILVKLRKAQKPNP
jgi:hypothetical protein